MARVATISIHAVVLLAMKDVSHPLDLDIIGSWFILSETAVAVPLMISWAPALQKSKARFLVRIWGVLVSVGAICGYVAMQWSREHIDERTCLGNDVVIDHGSSLALRKNVIFAGLAKGTVFNGFDIAAVAATSFGLWICLRPASWSQSTPKKEPQRLVYLVEMTGLVFASVVIVAVVVLHERYMFSKPPVPMLLPVTSFEQWNCWAATGIIAIATLTNWLYGGRHKRRTIAVNFSEPTNSAFPAKSDLEWAGIVGRPSPSYVR
jgi:hypothetical protein